MTLEDIESDTVKLEDIESDTAQQITATRERH